MAELAIYDPLATVGGWRRRRARLGVYAILAVVAVYSLLPLAIIVLNSFRDLDDIGHRGLIAIPLAYSLAHWDVVWNKFCVSGGCNGIAPFFYNSLEMTIPATIISTAIGAINGYVLSAWRFRGSETLFHIMTLGVFMPGQMVLLPWAITLGTLGLTNTIGGLVLIHCVQGISFTTLFCRNYYVSIPDDLIKAARLAGAGFWRIFRKIVLPLSPPILIVTVIWQFTGIWNEFLFAVVFSSGSGQPITGTPQANGFGQVVQGSLETSNVDVTEQMVDLIAAQRAYEVNSKAIATTDTMMQDAINDLSR